jgi:hypothetical protein
MGRSRSRGRKRRPARPAANRAARPAIRRPPGSPFASNRFAYGLVGAMLLVCGGGFIYDRFVEHKDCVDSRTGQVVDGSQCRHSTGSGIYRWYYGGTSRGVGTEATGGSFERGGFGRFVGSAGG